MLDTIVILIISLLVLGKSAKIVIDSALVLARFFRVSELARGIHTPFSRNIPPGTRRDIDRIR